MNGQHKIKKSDKTSKDKNYYDQIESKRKKINDKLLKMLERVELDRPILLKEKFNVLWNFDEIYAEKDVIQQRIEQKKLERCRINKQMAVKYNHMLDYIS